MSGARRLRMAIVSGIMLVAACADAPNAPETLAPPAGPDVVLASRALPRFGDWLADQVRIGTMPPSSDWPVLVGAGDIAECYDGAVPPPLEQARARALASPAALTA